MFIVLLWVAQTANKMGRKEIWFVVSSSSRYR